MNTNYICLLLLFLVLFSSIFVVSLLKLFTFNFAEFDTLEQMHRQNITRVATWEEHIIIETHLAT